MIVALGIAMILAGTALVVLIWNRGRETKTFVWCIGASIMIALALVGAFLCVFS